MTDAELLAMPKVGPEEASRFLGGDPSAEYIRVWCQDGTCPFGACVQMSKHRKNYTINRRLLIRYRDGEITASIPKIYCNCLKMHLLRGGEETWTGSRHGQA